MSGIVPTSPFFSALLVLSVLFIVSDISNLAILALSASSAVIPSVICVDITSGSVVSSVVSVTAVGVSTVSSTGFEPLSFSICIRLVLILSASSAVIPSCMSSVGGDKSRLFDLASVLAVGCLSFFVSTVFVSTVP